LHIRWSGVEEMWVKMFGMFNHRLMVWVVLVVSGVCAFGQMPGFPPVQGERVQADAAIARALKASTLTEDGKPFHAVMEIGKAGTPYTGRVEVWWAAKEKYKLVVTSPKFGQTRIVNGAAVMEKDEGDYFPRWLENFVDAILDPLPMVDQFRGGSGMVMVGPQITNSCLQRDDRRNGITDVMTWGIVCFRGSKPNLESVLTMNYNVQFADWKGFGKKEIARGYTTEVLGYQEVAGKLTTLEELKSVPEDWFAVTTPTPAAEQIRTAFVSTQKEESLLESAPKIEWPTVHEGKTDGYMIVYARTDRTGQVRESAKHNSDQPGLEEFGMQQALKFKFKPLVVDGVAVQMEMPLVLHFTTKVADPLPMLTGAELLKQMSGCDARLVTTAPAGAKPTSIAVNEAGKLTGEGWGPEVNAGSPAVLVKVKLAMGLECRFAPYLRNGVPWYYHGALLVERGE